MAKADLITEAEALGIQLTGDETAAQLSELIGQKKGVGSSVAGAPSDPQPPAPTDTVVPVAPQPVFDISKLTPDQLKELKAALAETPEKSQIGGHTITVRRFEDKYVVGILPSKTKTVLDPIEQKPVTKVTIPVMFYGEDNYVDFDYKEFMQWERVKCSVVSIREAKNIRIEGIVYSMERKREVEQVVNLVMRYYTVKLPNGQQIEMFEEACNL